MIMLVMLVQTLVYREVTALFSIGAPKSKKDDDDDEPNGKDPWSKTLNWYFFVVTNFFLYGESIIYYFKVSELEHQYDIIVLIFVLSTLSSRIGTSRFSQQTTASRAFRYIQSALSALYIHSKGSTSNHNLVCSAGCICPYSSSSFRGTHFNY